MNPDSASPSPSSPPRDSATTGNGQSKASTLPKDRPCPFCGQSFTSSSLGRHLDLYIKDKNPKPPDGVHDVDAIRNLRGKITRRQPKGSGTTNTGPAGHKRTASGELLTTNSSAPNGGTFINQDADTMRRESQPNGESETPLQHVSTDSSAGYAEGRTGSTSAATPRDESSRAFQSKHDQSQFPHQGSLGIPSRDMVNHDIPVPKINWQATGVINDLPDMMRSPNAGSSYQQPRRDTNLAFSATQTRSQLDGDSSLVSIALRDILNSIQRAHCRIQRPPAFPTFDPMSLNYPALVLRLLGPPPSLFSSTPLPAIASSPDSWPLGEPPTGSLKPRIQQTLRVRLKMHTSLCPPPELGLAKNRVQVEEGIRIETDKRCAEFNAHVDAALEQWESFTRGQREEIWRLEMLRLCAAHSTEISDLERRLEKTTDVVEELRAELARLRESNAQLLTNGLWAQEGRDQDASRAPVIARALAKEFLESDITGDLGPGNGWMNGVGAQKWDVDNVLKRYKDIVEHEDGPQPMWPSNAWRVDQILKEGSGGANAAERSGINEGDTRSGRAEHERERANGPAFQDSSMNDAPRPKRSRLHELHNLTGDFDYGHWGPTLEQSGVLRKT